MPDIVITPNRGTSNNPKIDFTGTSAGTIKLEVLGDGTIAWNGANGSLFSIADSLSGSLMSVNDISGLPAFEVFSDNRVIVGQFGARLGIGTVNPSSTAKLHIAGLNTAPPNVFLQTTNSSANGGIFWRNNSNATTSAIASNYNVSDASGNIEFLSGGANTRMVIASGGNVSIGSTSSVTKLLVEDSTSRAGEGSFQVKNTVGNASIRLEGAATNNYVYLTWAQAGVGKWEYGIDGANTNSNFYINSNIQVGATGALQYFDRANGRVGIGTNSPSHKLDVSISAASSNFLTDANVYPFAIKNSDATAGNAVGMVFGHGTSAYTNFIASVRTGVGAVPTGDLVFGGRPADNTNFVERIRIVGTTGNVGIGTTSPLHRLQIAGTTHVGIGGANAGDITGVLQIGGGGTYYMTQIKAINTTSTPSIQRARMAFFTLSGVGETAADATEKMSILADSGNVGIGIVAPTHKLEVSGNIISKFSSVNGSGFLQYSGTTHIFSLTRQTNDVSISGYAGVGLAPNATTGASSTYALYANSSGNIGIGTTSPTQKLHVENGNIKVTNSSSANIIVNDPLGMAAIVWQDNGIEAALFYTDFGNAFITSQGLGSSIYLQSNGSNNVFAFDYTGRLGIGTTNPAYTLHAIGSIGDSIGDVRILPQNSKSIAYTTVLSDSGKHIFHPSADTTARTFTINSNANVPYQIGTALTFINQNGAGVITISITSDVMRLAGSGTTGSRTLAANGVATAVKITSTEWIISGTGLT